MLELLHSPRRFFRDFDPSWQSYVLATIGYLLAQLTNELEDFVGGPNPDLAYIFLSSFRSAAFRTALVTFVWLFVPIRILGGRITIPRTYAMAGLAALLPSAFLSVFLLHILPATQTSETAFFGALAGCFCFGIWWLCLLGIGVKEVAALSWFKSVVVVIWPIALILGAATWILVTERMDHAVHSDVSIERAVGHQIRADVTPNTSFQRTQVRALRGLGPLNSDR